MGTVEACRQLGNQQEDRLPVAVGERPLPPERVSDTLRSGRYLSLLERKRITALRERGLGIREIADLMDHSPSTISRELRRNMP